MNPDFLGRVAYLPTYEAMQALTATRTENTPDELWICEHEAVYTQGLAGKKEHIFNPGNIPVIQTNRGGQVTYHGPGQVVAYPLLDLKRAGYFVKEYVYRIEEAVIRTLMHFDITGHRVAGAPGIYVRLDDPRSHAMLPQRPMKRVTDAPDIGSATLCSGDVIPGLTRDPWIADPVRNDSLHVQPGTQPAPPVHQSHAPDFTGLGKIAALGIKVSRNCTYHGVALNVVMDLQPYSRINPCGYQALQTVDLSTIGVLVSWQEAAEVLASKLVIYLGH